eukprot:CAMPEP_0181258456 /NCGR_PEP_ID=MMETSP1096-20121128/50789_1 /TAXON_ID=156174 ORGANISM="Chrysochromulina ericina, Strain CCMP281" /NCGR_SAMPLE_ID=MMETSP1096 /ASSEMBLY_ACC=CAM_ASM_000453 /LENGTH=43 /DNA_ID= /DNA_START= /DNA_END= /DNA_ORIENTATION=
MKAPWSPTVSVGRETSSNPIGNGAGGHDSRAQPQRDELGRHNP